MQAQVCEAFTESCFVLESTTQSRLPNWTSSETFFCPGNSSARTNIFPFKSVCRPDAFRESEVKARAS